MSLAAGIGPVVGGELVRAFGWPSIFAVNLPVIAVSALLAAIAGPGEIARSREPAHGSTWSGPCCSQRR